MSDKPTWLRDLPPQDRARMRGCSRASSRSWPTSTTRSPASSTCCGAPTSWPAPGSSSSPTTATCWASTGSSQGAALRGVQRRPVRRPRPRRGARHHRRARAQVDLMPTTLDIAGLDPDSRSRARRPLHARPAARGDWTNSRRRLLVENLNLGWRCSASARAPTSSTTSAASGSLQPGPPIRTSSPAATTPTSATGPSARHRLRRRQRDHPPSTRGVAQAPERSPAGLCGGESHGGVDVGRQALQPLPRGPEDAYLRRVITLVRLARVLLVLLLATFTISLIVGVGPRDRRGRKGGPAGRHRGLRRHCREGLDLATRVQELLQRH